MGLWKYRADFFKLVLYTPDGLKLHMFQINPFIPLIHVDKNLK